MKIKLARHMGLCFGVKDAIQLAEETAKTGPVTIFGPLAHNPSIKNRLLEQGIEFTEQHQHARTDTLIVTAHGTSDRMRQEIRCEGCHLPIGALRASFSEETRERRLLSGHHRQGGPH